MAKQNRSGNRNMGRSAVSAGKGSSRGMSRGTFLKTAGAAVAAAGVGISSAKSARALAASSKSALPKLRKAAGQRFAQVMAQQAVIPAVLDPTAVPHYYGPFPNYANSPIPRGPITSITVENGGSGYIDNVFKIIDSDGLGSGAKARCVVVGSAITQITLLSGGSGYDGTDVTLVDPYGIGADSVATVSVDLGGAITSINLTDGGSGYKDTVLPTVMISDLYQIGDNAQATVANIENGGITEISVDIGGADYQAPKVMITDAFGTGATAIASIKGPAVIGGMKKFVNPLPDIPVAVPDTTTYEGCDYYEIAIVEFYENSHSDLPDTKYRGYVQLNTPNLDLPLGHIPEPLLYPNGDPILLTDGSQAMAVYPPKYMGPTMVAQRNRPVRIRFHNLLPTGADGDLFIPVDPTVMGAGMTYAKDEGENLIYDENMMGLHNRTSVHLHGGYVPWISDGTPHQWFLPAGETSVAYTRGVSSFDVPDMWFDENGNVVPDTEGQMDPPFIGATNSTPGCMTFYYNNEQSARLMFYHDHAYGITRLNVYAGMAAGYLVNDEFENDMINGTNDTGINPGELHVIPDIGIPLVIQDKTFVPDLDTLAYQDPTWDVDKWGGEGQLWMPHVYMPNQNPADPGGMNAFGRWHYGPWFWPPTENIMHGPIPNPYYDPVNAPWENETIPPLHNLPEGSMAMEAFMDVMVVNGVAFPYLEVEPRAYRFRILSVGNDRFLNLQMYEADPTVITPDGRYNTEVKMIPAEGLCMPGYPATWPTDGREGGVPDWTTAGPSWIQIGNEGGFLPKPVVIPPQPVDWNADPTTFNVGNVSTYSLLLGPAERADVIVDFSQFAGKTIILYNDAPAAFPARDPRYDYYTDSPDLTDIGGVPPILPGYGPNTRTVMQFRVANIDAADPYVVADLEAVFAKTEFKRGVFEKSQDPVLVPQAEYNSAYEGDFAEDPYVRIYDNFINFDNLAGQPLSIHLEPKAIQDEMGEAYDLEYGRMSAMLGLERPFTAAGAQNFMLFPFGSPPVDIIMESMDISYPMLGDNTQVWKITHNGVDTHTLHFHLFNVQLINHVAWDNQVRPPDLNELGWKETVRVDPLEDTIVAMRPVIPSTPFKLPNSIRPIDMTKPLGDVLMGPPGGFFDVDANPVTIVNHMVNYGHEYMMHCHLLGHEEMDMMHGLSIVHAPDAPSDLNASLQGTSVTLSWMDNSLNETGFVVESAHSMAGPWTTLATLPTSDGEGEILSYTDTTYQPNEVPFYYRVSAINTVGDTTEYPEPAVGFTTMTSSSEPVTIGPPTIAPVLGIPTQAAKKNSPVELSWTYAGSGQSGFVIQRAEDPAFTTKLRTFTSTTLTYSDTNTKSGTAYYYRVAAFTFLGTGAWSNTQTITTN